MRKAKIIGLVLLIAGYIVAGINHFVHPSGYLKIIPDYIPMPVAINYISGSCEIVFAIMMIFKATRSIAGWLIVLMLAAFMPVHITMALEAPLTVGTVLVTPLLAWLRIVLQPVLMYWAWWNTRL